MKFLHVSGYFSWTQVTVKQVVKCYVGFVSFLFLRFKSRTSNHDVMA